ncbi:hypothetical protein [Methanobacterium alkalithermotolerans]|nr:hypothetical protein [Methanobacterium alkalithermotolerans]
MERKNYEKPELKMHGKLKDITRGGGEGAGDGPGSFEPDYSGES